MQQTNDWISLRNVVSYFHIFIRVCPVCRFPKFENPVQFTGTNSHQFHWDERLLIEFITIGKVVTVFSLFSSTRVRVVHANFITFITQLPTFVGRCMEFICYSLPQLHISVVSSDQIFTFFRKFIYVRPDNGLLSNSNHEFRLFRFQTIFEKF